MNVLEIKIFDSPDEAPHYKRDMPDIRGAELHFAFIVRKGTKAGLSTVDLHLTDAEGQKFVAMVTGKLIKMLASAIAGAEARED